MNSRKQFLKMLLILFIGSLLLLESLARLVHMLVVG